MPPIGPARARADAVAWCPCCQSRGAADGTESPCRIAPAGRRSSLRTRCGRHALAWLRDRKSTRLNSSHVAISYAVVCLKKKKVSRYGSKQTKRETDRILT